MIGVRNRQTLRWLRSLRAKRGLIPDIPGPGNPISLAHAQVPAWHNPLDCDEGQSASVTTAGTHWTHFRRSSLVRLRAKRSLAANSSIVCARCRFANLPLCRCRSAILLSPCESCRYNPLNKLRQLFSSRIVHTLAWWLPRYQQPPSFPPRQRHNFLVPGDCFDPGDSH